jgi:cellulose biosynthesis protein BcsQ
MKYIVWNNKGGVGKTFLTYCLAVEYALKNPETTVVVLDMCPQANVSEMLLGGNGRGEENLVKYCENERTVAGYIKRRYSSSPFSLLGNEVSYFTRVSEENGLMPPNLYLLPGDIDLDICASIIDYIALAPQSQAWIRSRKFLVDLVAAFEKDHKEDKVFFIDANPSFANYTQNGMLAAERIIVPCTADFASLRGISNLMRLIFGIKTANNVSDDAFDTFNTKLKAAGIPFPKIHLFVLNKTRTMNKNMSAAYRSHVHQIETTVKQWAKEYTDLFVPLKRTKRIFHVKDCNTLSPVINYGGMPPSSLQHKKYPVYEEMTQASRGQIDAFRDNLSKIIENL